MGRNIWVAFQTFGDSKVPIMIMKWCTNEVRAIDEGETVIFLDEDGKLIHTIIPNILFLLVGKVQLEH